MSLFVDGTISQIPELTEFESSLADVAATESIDLSAKLNVAKLELSLEIQKFLLQQQPESTSGFDVGSPIGIQNVVVTEALKQWHALQAIAATYRDAYNQQLNDRYKGKFTEYATLAARAAEVAFSIGIGISNRPIAKPDKPIVTQTVGTHLAGTWYVATSWISQQGVEGSPSNPAVLTIGDGSSLKVAVTRPPENVAGWNVYLGPSDIDLHRQNDTPLQPANEWLLPNSIVKTQFAPTNGQVADYYLRKRNLLRRG